MFRNNKIYKIIDNVYLSNLYSAHDLNLIKQNNIKTVVCLLDQPMPNIYDPSITFFSFVVADNINSKKQMIELAKKIYYIITTTDDNILIHCWAGISRSVTVIIFYMIKYRKFRYHEAYNYIKKIKWDVGPNSGFVEELKKIENY